METTETKNIQDLQNLQNHVVQLLVNHNKLPSQVIRQLVEGGFEREMATIFVKNIESQINSARKKRAYRDIIFGSLWCFGGIILTAAHIGFIFWGAIVFGGIQIIRGLISLS